MHVPCIGQSAAEYRFVSLFKAILGEYIPSAKMVCSCSQPFFRFANQCTYNICHIQQNCLPDEYCTKHATHITLFPIKVIFREIFLYLSIKKTSADTLDI